MCTNKERNHSENSLTAWESVLDPLTKNCSFQLHTQAQGQSKDSAENFFKMDVCIWNKAVLKAPLYLLDWQLLGELYGCENSGECPRLNAIIAVHVA